MNSSIKQNNESSISSTKISLYTFNSFYIINQIIILMFCGTTITLKRYANLFIVLISITISLLRFVITKYTQIFIAILIIINLALMLMSEISHTGLYYKLLDSSKDISNVRMFELTSTISILIITIAMIYILYLYLIKKDDKLTSQIHIGYLISNSIFVLIALVLCISQFFISKEKRFDKQYSI